MYLKKLKKLLNNDFDKKLYPCIEDLVSNGLKLERFSDEENRPSRQDVTQFIAAWFKYIGLSADECRKWMIDYCIGVLSILSSSSLSRIRHSTKSNIKYIYKSDVDFDCKRHKNRFKARCETTCPIYEEMAHVAAKRVSETNTVQEGGATSTVKSPEIKIKHKIKHEKAPKKIVEIKQPVKDQYRDQFEKAIQFVQKQLITGMHKQKIVKLLNDNGFKTITGKEWSYGILSNELRKLNNTHRYY